MGLGQFDFGAPPIDDDYGADMGIDYAPNMDSVDHTQSQDFDSDSAMEDAMNDDPAAIQPTVGQETLPNLPQHTSADARGTSVVQALVNPTINHAVQLPPVTSLEAAPPFRLVVQPPVNPVQLQLQLGTPIYLSIFYIHIEFDRHPYPRHSHLAPTSTGG